MIFFLEEVEKIFFETKKNRKKSLEKSMKNENSEIPREKNRKTNRNFKKKTIDFSEDVFRKCFGLDKIFLSGFFKNVFSKMKIYFLVGSFLDQRFIPLERRKKVTARSEQFSDRGIKKYSIDPTLRIVFQ